MNDKKNKKVNVDFYLQNTYEYNVYRIKESQ